MSCSRVFRLICAALMLGFTLVAQAAEPSIKLTNPSTAVLETDQESIRLQGSAILDGVPASVHWVNQFGQRGVGTWSATAPGVAAWTVPDIALHLGVNLITVTVVDPANRSAYVHIAVNRILAPDTAPTPAPKVATGALHNRPITYQIRNGHAVVEGDIIVDVPGFSAPGADTLPAAVGTAGIPNPGSAIDYTSQLWTSVTGVYQVPYVVTGSSSNLTNAINYFNATFSGLIQFVAWSGQTNYVEITVLSGGSTEGQSWVGVKGGPQPLQCGSGCSEATWLHEMGHTVGLLHEHQRPDRLNYITLNLANADLPNVPGNFTLFAYDYQTIGLYDYASVMHYCSFCFSKAGQPVLESVPAGIPLSNEVGYSAGDIDQIYRLYGATPSKVTVTTNPVGLAYVVDSTTYTAPTTFSFALNSTHTLSVPSGAQTTTPADGSAYVFGNWNDLGASTHTIFVVPGAGTLASPAKQPAVTVYQANFIRMQPFAFLSPAAYPAGSGTVSVSPEPTSMTVNEVTGSYFVDRTLVTLKYTRNPGFDFYDWFNLPYPPSDNPHSFYIQAPTTSAQAVFAPSSSPVTIVGESITGPNTWNPLLVGYVDGKFTILPSGFSAYNNYNATWGPGTSHSISVNQTQSPVTTNIFYNWNSWSDGGAISHNITQLHTGSQTITSSFTPFYASYTAPTGSCAGSVATFPAGVSYSLNASFDFYEDGTSVMSTATPNPAFPAMVFAGWAPTTGGLTGALNPQTIAVHAQFVPTANFNMMSAPLAITSLSPASAIVSATAAPVITINGTGFVSGDTYVYWNTAYRTITSLTATKLTVQLQAGDLASPGGQDVYVGNYTTNSNGTCSAAAETSFTVDPTARGKGVTVATLLPGVLGFAATQVNSTAPAQTLTLANTGTAALTIGSIALWGPNASSFVIDPNTCGSTLAAGTNCTIGVAFAPTVAGALSGTLAVTDDASGSPQTVILRGTGTAPAVTLTPAKLSFPSTAVGSTSAPQTVTLKNTGSAPLAITSIAVGGSNASSFAIPTNGCASTLAAAASCTFTVAFQPAAAGALTGTVSVTDDAANSPQAVTLSGTGTSP